MEGGNYVVVDWRSRRLDRIVCLNCFHYGGSFPREMVERSGTAGLPVPRCDGSIGGLAGHEGCRRVREGKK